MVILPAWLPCGSWNLGLPSGHYGKHQHDQDRL